MQKLKEILLHEKLGMCKKCIGISITLTIISFIMLMMSIVLYQNYIFSFFSILLLATFGTLLIIHGISFYIRTGFSDLKQPARTIETVQNYLKINSTLVVPQKLSTPQKFCFEVLEILLNTTTGKRLILENIPPTKNLRLSEDWAKFVKELNEVEASFFAAHELTHRMLRIDKILDASGGSISDEAHLKFKIEFHSEIAAKINEIRIYSEMSDTLRSRIRASIRSDYDKLTELLILKPNKFKEEVLQYFFEPVGQLVFGQDWLKVKQMVKNDSDYFESLDPKIIETIKTKSMGEYPQILY